jgi:hypothetical protein
LPELHKSSGALVPVIAATAVAGVVIVLFRAFLARRRPVNPVIVSIVALASLVGLLVTSAGGSVFAIARSLSGAFAVAAVALIATLASVVGPRVLPEAGVVARRTIAALAGLGAWRLAAWPGTGSLPMQIASAFLAGYLLVLIAPPTNYRTDAMGAIRSGPELWTGRAKSR